MNIIIPENYKNVSIDKLLLDKKIVYAKDNPAYINNIFPQKTRIGKIDNFDKSKIITQIDDELFSDFYIMDKKEQIIYIKDNTVRKYIKCKEYGDYENSHKRYNGVNSPFDHNVDSIDFINITPTDPLPVTNNNFRYFQHPDIEILSLDDTNNNLPEIKKPTNNRSRFNDLTTIQYVLKWAKEQGINYIYQIVENRPYIFDKTYTSPFVYYTVIGSTGEYIKDSKKEEIILPTHTVINNSLSTPPNLPIPPTPSNFATVFNSNNSFFVTLNNGDNLLIPDTKISVDTNHHHDLPATEQLKIFLKDQNNNIIPVDSTTLNNNDLDINLSLSVITQWSLFFYDMNDTIKIDITTSNIGTFNKGTGADVGTITVSTDNNTFVPLTFPYIPNLGDLWFKRSDTLISGTYVISDELP